MIDPVVSEIPEGAVVADVRSYLDDRVGRDAYDAGHIPGSVFEAYHDIDGVPEGVDPARPVAVVCASGQRAAVAASLLKRHGAADVIHVVDGGVPLWERSGWPVERG